MRGMMWWTWGTSGRLSLMLGLLATSVLLTWWTIGGPGEGRAFFGGCAFFAIPLVVGFYLLVGLRTGLLPSRGPPVSRKDESISFWTFTGLHAAVIAMWLYVAAVMFLGL
jgi:hypothetical protein